MNDQYTFSELADLIESLSPRYSQKIIAIDGLGGSGKKTFTEALHRAVPHSAVVHIDDFVKREHERVTKTPELVDPNIDWDRFEREIITPLRYSAPIVYHKYNSLTGELGESVKLSPSVPIFVEGGFVTQNRFAENYDFKIWIESSDSVRMTRILESKGEKKWKEWQDSERPIEERYVEHEKHNLRADLVVDGDHANFKEGYYGVIKV